jgi:hypothetical protein
LTVSGDFASGDLEKEVVKLFRTKRLTEGEEERIVDGGRGQ